MPTLYRLKTHHLGQRASNLSRSSKMASITACSCTHRSNEWRYLAGSGSISPSPILLLCGRRWSDSEPDVRSCMCRQKFRFQALSGCWLPSRKLPLCGKNRSRCSLLCISYKEGQMSGPFTLKYLHLFLREKSAGAFILSRNGTSADFVGSGPQDLADAIRRAARESEYRYFWFAATSTSRQAYELEHGWYHRYRPTDNRTPPVPYPGLDWRCTIEGCAACALASLKMTG